MNKQLLEKQEPGATTFCNLFEASNLDKLVVYCLKKNVSPNENPISWDQVIATLDENSLLQVVMHRIQRLQ